MKDRMCSRGHSFRGSEPCPTCWPGYRTFSIKEKVWLYPGDKAAWHFLTLPKEVSDVIHERFEDAKRGWGSQRVKVTIGHTSWNTSIFPDKKTGSYLLPIKVEVRKKEHIETGQTITLNLTIDA